MFGRGFSEVPSWISLSKVHPEKALHIFSITSPVVPISLAMGMMLLTSECCTFCDRASMLRVVFGAISQISELTFVTRRSLQFFGFLIFSFRLRKVGSFRPDARRLSTSDDTLSCRVGSVCSFLVTFFNKPKRTLSSRRHFLPWFRWLVVGGVFLALTLGGVQQLILFFLCCIISGF